MHRHRVMAQEGVTHNNCQLGTSLSLFFLYSQFPQSPGPYLHQNLFFFLQNPEISRLLIGAAKQSQVRELVGDWIVSACEPEFNDRLAQQAMYGARRYQLDKPSRIVCEQVLTRKEALVEL